MALIAKNHIKGDESVKADPLNNLLELQLRETEILLSLVKNSMFKGEDVEFIYNLVLKLQQLYISQKNK